jgi:hypothetical protein
MAFLIKFCKICQRVSRLWTWQQYCSFTEKGRQPCVQPPTWRTGSLYLCSPVTEPKYQVNTRTKTTREASVLWAKFFPVSHYTPYWRQVFYYSPWNIFIFLLVLLHSLRSQQCISSLRTTALSCLNIHHVIVIMKLYGKHKSWSSYTVSPFLFLSLFYADKISYKIRRFWLYVESLLNIDRSIFHLSKSHVHNEVHEVCVNASELTNEVKIWQYNNHKNIFNSLNNPKISFIISLMNKAQICHTTQFICCHYYFINLMCYIHNLLFFIRCSNANNSSVVKWLETMNGAIH